MPSRAFLQILRLLPLALALGVLPQGLRGQDITILGPYGYEPPVIKSRYFPTLPAKPNGPAGKYRLWISTQGKVTALTAVTPLSQEESKSFTQALAHWDFIPGQLAGEVASGLVTLETNDCFYPVRPYPEGTVLPVARWKFERELIDHFRSLELILRLQETERLEFIFSIGADGTLQKVHAGNSILTNFAKLVFTPKVRQLLRFEPLKVDGVPQPCRMIWSIAPMKFSDMSTGLLDARDPPEGFLFSRPTVDELPYPAGAAVTGRDYPVRYWVSFQSGDLVSVLFQGGTDEVLKRDLAKRLRSLLKPSVEGYVEFEGVLMVSPVNRRITPTEGPDVVSIQGGAALDLRDAAYPIEFARTGIQGHAVSTYVVLEDGTVDSGSITVVGSHRAFEKATRTAVSHWTFAPLKRNGAAIKFRMRCYHTFTLK